MNIFFTDEDPYKCAQLLDNKRVNKMLLESCQMLSTAVNVHHGSQIAPYKNMSPNHPSNLWCRKTRQNWTWLWYHAKALSDEYTFRGGKIHACAQIVRELLELRSEVPEGPLTPFANCAANKSLGLDYKSIQPVTEAYRAYLTERWKTDKLTPKWTNRPNPLDVWHKN